MNQYNHVYVYEKLIRIRQSEIDQEFRKGLYLKAISHGKTKEFKQAEVQRGFWHKWFGSKRLSTSWK